MAYQPKVYFWRNRVILPIAAVTIGPILAWLKGAKCHRYTPRSKTFLFLANHVTALDPAYAYITFRRYIRFVASDHVVRQGLLGWFLNFFGTPLIKYRDHPREEITENILATLRAGISVGLHAEGGISWNGGSRYISPNTARLIKDAGCAVITFRNYGGYLQEPRWARHKRKGPLWSEVVREYSPQEIAAMSEEEVYRAICRDLDVNAYEVQRRQRRLYPGQDLAESCEIVLYRCPRCQAVGALHSHGDLLSCDCGYTLRMESDGFFHDCGQGVVYDDLLSWDLWQRDALGPWLDTFQGDLSTPIFRDVGQRLSLVRDNRAELLSEHAVLELYYDRLELRWETGARSIPLSGLKSMIYARVQALLIVTAEDYFDVDSAQPRSPIKYIDAWRHLTGRPNYAGMSARRPGEER